MLYSVRKLHGRNEDFYPTEKLDSQTNIDAVRQYCKIHDLGSPVDLVHSADNVYTAVDNSKQGNVVGKFEVFEVN